MRKDRRKWARMSSILGREGSDPGISKNFYKSVVQVTLMFRAETWLMPPRIGKTLGGFHHRVVRRMEKMQPRMDISGRWV